MVSMKPDKDNPRRIHIIVNENMKFPISMNEYFRRFEIEEIQQLIPEFTMSSLYSSLAL